jgi:hypoxanthine phosphoribosyltransferase
MRPEHVAGDLAAILWTEEQIVARLGELAAQIEADYRNEDGTDQDLLLVGVLGGAAVMTADLARAFDRHIEISWMGLSSYRAGPGRARSARRERCGCARTWTSTSPAAMSSSSTGSSTPG